MSDLILQSFVETIKFILGLLRDLSLPLAIIVGAGLVAYAVKGSVLGRDGNDLTRSFGRIAAYVVPGVFVVFGWVGLKAVGATTWGAVERQRVQESSEEPVIEAPLIEQPGPVAAAMVEKTYTRTLTLPPEFFERVGAEGVGALSPYLVDPTAENVKAMVDSFRRSGQDVVFSRELTRSDESPVPFDAAGIDVKFRRLGERAYHVAFNAEYRFTNSTGAPAECRFLFYPPANGGTIQALRVQVGGQKVGEPDERGYYAWSGTLAAGQQALATVSYESVGTAEWVYQVGSFRRRVHDFRLTATVEGPVEFRVGTINPSTRTDDKVEWRLNDVLTSQSVGLVFPEDIAARDAFFDAVTSLPSCMMLVLAVLIAIGLRTGRTVSPKRFALVVTVVVIGLGSSSVLYGYLGYAVSLAVGSVVAAVAASAATEWRSVFALLPVSLFPCASMSQKNPGLWLLLFAVASLGLLVSPVYARKSLADR